ncbi:MAG: tetratricopeptide repeat protein [Ferrovum sp.]|nr:tetratricopeptide repeat protein [Ferrovum sp.]NDU87746.1 tetratricopeptide repeat protein [Ferrovum sp.]
MKNVWRGILVAGLLIQAAEVWAEPTLDQVYEATRSGQLSEAKSMMQEVLRAHPNSAKAHFVEAEVLARSGDLAGGRVELTLAKKLQPNLGFASPSSVELLQRELDPSSSGVGAAGIQPNAAGVGREGSHTPWGTLLTVGGLALLLVMWLVRRQNLQNPGLMNPGGMRPGPSGFYNNGMGGGAPMSPMGGGGGGLMGSLATGAALGAGMVAGEALAHHLVDGSSEGIAGSGGNTFPEGGGNQDLGGKDFGVSDGGGWDSSSDGGGWGSGDSGSDWT